MSKNGLVTFIVVVVLAFSFSGCAADILGLGSAEQEPDTYTVAYFGNNADTGTVPTDDTRYEPGDEVVVRDNTGGLTRAEFNFVGWNTERDGSGTGYLPGDTFIMGSSNITLFARWEPQEADYSVTYHGNGSSGGSVPVDSSTYQRGDLVTVLGNTGGLLRDGYTFAGWNAEADGSGTAYAAGDTFTMESADVTLFAQWTATAIYQVGYKGNGNINGSVPVDAAAYEQGALVTVLGNTGGLVRDGYTFAGWNTEQDGSGTAYAAGDTFTMGSSDVFLYAQWTANPTFTVTYDGNGKTGGSVPVDGAAYEEGDAVTVLGNTGGLVRDGYTFAGWNTEGDGTGTAYAAGDTFAMGSADVVLYSQWTANPTFTVTYDGNGNTGGSVPVDSAAYEEGNEVTVLGNSGGLVRDGYTFAGWNTEGDGTGTAYAKGDTFAMGSADVVLYAQWIANPTFSVTYDGNGNTGGSVPVDGSAYEEGAEVTVLGNSGGLVRDGYTFAGWNTASDGSGTNYVAGDTFLMNATDITLHAEWQEAGSVDVMLEDTFITAEYPGNNYGSAEIARFGNLPSHPAYEFFPLFRLDHSQIADGFTSVTLRLYFIGKSVPRDLTIEVYRITGSWDENAVTYTGAPGIDTTTAWSTVVTGLWPTTTDGSYFDVDLTAIVQAWKDGTHSNHGIALVPVAMSGGNTYYQIDVVASETSTYPDYVPEVIVE